MQIPTIKVKREGGKGFRLINRKDFDPAVHVALPDDPLDHDADGKKGGSLPAQGPDAAADKPAAPKAPTRRKRKG